MNRWVAYHDKTLVLPAVVQVDASGVLVALADGTFAGPYAVPEIYPGDAYYVAVATAPPAPDTPLGLEAEDGTVI